VSSPDVLSNFRILASRAALLSLSSALLFSQFSIFLSSSDFVMVGTRSSRVSWVCEKRRRSVAGPLSSMWAKKETLKWQPGVRPNPLPGRLGLVPAKSSRERHGGEKLRLGSLGLECLLTRIMPPLAWDRWSGPGSNLEVRCAAAHRWTLDRSSGRFDIAFGAQGPAHGGVGARRPTAVADVGWGLGRKRGRELVFFLFFFFP